MNTKIEQKWQSTLDDLERACALLRKRLSPDGTLEQVEELYRDIPPIEVRIGEAARKCQELWWAIYFSEKKRHQLTPDEWAMLEGRLTP